MTILDIEDPNIIDPLIQSLKLWVEFLDQGLGRSQKIIDRFKNYIHAIENGTIDDPNILRILFHSILDVNQTLLLSEILDANIYDWEDYCSYYQYKLLRAGKLYETNKEAQTFSRLIEFFVPNFEINSVQELIKIRSNPRLDSVKKLLKKIRPDDVDKTLVQDARLDVLEIDAEVSGYIKIFEWIAEPFGLIPIVGSAVKTAMKEVSERVIRKQAIKGHEWKFFFSDLRKLYRKQDVLSI
jgi:hypothetical protein